MWKSVADAFVQGYLDPSILETLIVLIPKVYIPDNFKDLIPISLSCVLYKILTKVLVARLRPFLCDLIGPLQGSFIPGRSSADNIIIAQKVVHYMKKSKVRKVVLAMKIYQVKAYDNDNWDYCSLVSQLVL